MPDNIVLIGFMGVGKGQVGRALSASTSMYAVDCDDLIESMTNLKIKKIFAKFGEKEFRKFENRTAEWLRKNVTNTVISTGGGFVNVKKIKDIGKIVYLHAPFEYILEKIQTHPNAHKKIKKRPLLQDLKKAKELYSMRIPLYRKVADLEIDVSNKSVAVVVSEIATLLQLEEISKN